MEKWIVAVVLGLFIFFAFCARQESKDRREWLEFSSQHHCQIIPSGAMQPTRWQCDGFQVEHE